MEPVKVLHIITSLHADGAQNMLLKLVQNVDQKKFKYQIVSLLDAGVLGSAMKDAGAEVHCLMLNKPLKLLFAAFNLHRIIKAFQPHVIQGWMYHANLIALFATKYLSKSTSPALLWNIRRDLSKIKIDKFTTSITIRINAILSAVPKKIIYCGQKVAEDHFEIGFSHLNQMIIPNGFSSDRFAPSPEKFAAFREELKLPSDSVIVGMVGRYHRQKDHQNFIKMAACVLKKKPNTNFILVGKGCSWENEELVRWIEESGIKSRIILLGRRDDVQNILPVFDVFCLSSVMEGFPNVLGEAMSSGVVCVSTTAGASAEIIADDNRIAPVNDPQKLADRVLYVLNLPIDKFRKIQESSRARVMGEYNIERISNIYQELYGSISNDRK